MINRIIPEIIPVVIPTINQTTTDGFATSGRTLHAVCTIISKEIFTGATRSTAHFFKDPPVVNWKDTDGTIPREGNTVGNLPRLNKQVRIGAGSSISPTSIRIQEIESPRRSIAPQEVRNAQPFDTSINGISDKLIEYWLVMKNKSSK